MKERIESVKKRIERAAVSCGRDSGSVRLAAVSKTMGADRVRRAFEGGCRVFGENYIQEAGEKIAELADIDCTWHFIGRLQRNKAKYAVRLFELIHSVDSLKLAAEIDKQAKKIGRVQKILMQVNVAGEESKGGVKPEDAVDAAKGMSEFPNLKLCGLMAMPPFFDDPEKARPFFKGLYELSEKMKPELPENAELTELSMGMTGDFEMAIQEGATLVRIGTAIFGERNYRR